MNDAKNAMEQKKKSSLIFYIGGDEHLYTLLKPYFSKVLGTGVAFEMLECKDKDETQRLAIKIQNRHPKLIIVDISVNSKEMLHLIRILERMNFHPKTHVVGVTDATQSGSVVKEAIMAGINSIHVKSGEIDGIGFNCVALAFSDKSKEHEFAKAKMTDQTQCYVPAKISMVNKSLILVESNFKTTPGNYYFFESFFSKNNLLASTLMECKSSKSENLFYNYHYAHELFWPTYAGDSSEQEDSEEDFAQDSEAGAQLTRESFTEQNQKISKWIDTELKNSNTHPKPVKTLIVDRDLRILDSKRLSDTYDWVIRCQPYLLAPEKILRQILPQMIFFEHDEPLEDVNEEEYPYYNNYDALKRLVKAIRAIEGYEPFLIISHIERSTEDIQKREGYSKIIAYNNSIDSELVNIMASKLKNKIQNNLINTEEVVLDKLHKSSYGEFKINIELITCSELDLYFTSIEKFEIGTNLRLNFPVPMFVTIAPDPKGKSEKGTYYGLINAIKAEDQMALRRYINSVFFREKEAAKAAEQAEIEAKKKQFIEEKEKAAAEKIRLEEEEKKRKIREEEEAKLREIKDKKEAQQLEQEELEKSENNEPPE